MAEILKQGQSYTDTAGRTGTVQFDTTTGKRLAAGATTEVLPADTTSDAASNTADATRNTAITAQDLTTKQNPVVVPETPPSTKATGLQAEFEAMVAQRRKEQEAALTAAQETSKKSENDFTSAISEYLGKGAEQIKLEEAAKIGEKTQKVTDFTNQLEAEQHALRRQQEKIQKNERGLFGGAVNQELDRVTRESLSKQADIAILQSAANRDLATAQSLIDRKIELKYEPLKERLGFLEKFYDSNKADLTEAKKKEFESKIADENRVYEKVTADAKTLEQTKLQALTNAVQQGAPMDVQKAIQAATSPEDAIRAAGQWGGDILERQIKRAQLANINSEIAKRNAETRALDLPEVTDENAGKYSTALNIILGSAKFTKEQKADLIRSVNNGQDPFTTVKNQAKNIMGQTEATSLGKLEVARDTFNDIGNELAQFYALGGDTGIVKGTFEQFDAKLGKVSDPKLRELATQIQGNLQVYRNQISGTAYSAQEGKDILSIFPGINKSKSLNDAIISGRQKLFDSVIDATYRSALGPTYDSLKKAQIETEKIVPSEQTLTQKVNSLKTTQPALFKAVSGLMITVDPTTGKPYSVEDILQAFPELK